MPDTPPLAPIPADAPTPDVLRGVTRTVVPYLVGFVITWLGSRGINLPEDMQAQLASVITVVVGTLYYTAVRELEKRTPGFGWLLGSPHAPVYPSAISTSAITPGDGLVVKGPEGLTEPVLLVPPALAVDREPGA